LGDLKNLFSLIHPEYESVYGFGNYTFVKHVFLDGSLIQFGSVLIFVSLLFKLAVALFYFWFIDAYERFFTSPTLFLMGIFSILYFF